MPGRLRLECVADFTGIGSLGKISKSIGYGFAAVYAVRANVSYYKKMVQGVIPWF
jgi:hypothetical protein